MTKILKAFILVIFNLPMLVIAQDYKTKVYVYFDQPVTQASANGTTLRYNKDFAYSFTFDDGKEDAYTNAFPLYNGGFSSEANKTFPGLFYTDGCGNQVAFKGGLAWNSISSSGIDPHSGTAGSLQWNELVDLYNQGWNVYNHSYDHSTGPGTDYNYEVTENVSYVKNKTAINLTHFVIPSGDTGYIDPAFNNGMVAVYNQKGFQGSTGLNLDGNLNLNKFTFFRHFLEDAEFNQGNIASNIDMIGSKSNSSNHYWYSEFTHHVSVAPQNGGSLVFSTFEYYMNYIENKYGKSGKDNIWFAPLQDVYEYLLIKQKIQITSQMVGDHLEITLDFNQVPDQLLKYPISLEITADQNIKQVVHNGKASMSFNASSMLVNLEWPERPEGDPVITGVRGNIENCNVQIFPNPAQEKFSISVPEGHEYLFIVNDSKGVTISEQVFSNGNELFNIGTLTPGLYNIIIRRKDEGCIYQEKLIKK